MEPEYEVLSHLQENEITSQRKISKRTGLSLGAVNLLMKKMVRKGLVKVERLSARTVRYILTPSGMQEKSRLAYKYIRKSYHQILKINRALEELLIEWEPALNGALVILYGPADELREIMAHYLDRKGIYYQCFDQDALPRSEPSGENLVLFWRQEEEKTVPECFKAVNIMNML